MIEVFIQNEAGSDQKHYHDEKTLEWKRVATVSHPYPFPYGFIVGTSAEDGCNVDCFVITKQKLRTGQIVGCQALGLMEQIEDGQSDHNVLAILRDEGVQITDEIKALLTEHVLACFQHVAGKDMKVGKFLGAKEAEAHIATHRDLPT